MKHWQQWLPPLRRRLALPQTSLQLCLLGMLGGLIAALLIIVFRLAIIALQQLFLDHADNFVSITPELRLFLPIIGAVAIGVLALITGYRHTRLGIPFVIHRIKTAYGVMPFRNTLHQFFGGILALASGFSVGREGPSVHLGAYGASTVGRYLQLPYNSIRILAGCGIAAAISASFNTPLAAMIFVMEVVLREYRIHVFIPIMLAAVVGALATQLVFGHDKELASLPIISISFWHFPYLIFCGVIFGAVAFFFNQNLMRLLRFFKNWPLLLRLTIAGLVTAGVGYLVPHAMGAETGAIEFAVNSPTELQLLFIIFIGKMIMTIFALGLGVPGGIIGPVFGLGIVLGTILAIVPGLAMGDSSAAGTYAVLGMAGLMAATLHAPLAALVAVMELAGNQHIILPAMLVIVSAYVTTVQFFNNKSIFMLQLDFMQLPYKLAPADDVLQKVGVLALMNQQYRVLDKPDEADIHQHLAQLAPPEQLLIRQEQAGQVTFVSAQYDVSLSMSGDSVILYQAVSGLSHQATMAEVFALLEEQRDGMVYIYEQDLNMPVGVIRWDQVRSLLIKENNLL